MSKKILKIFVALSLAMLLAVSFAGCTPRADDATTFTIKLDYNDGYSRPGALYVVKGESAATPDEPFRKGYAFAGWYTAAEGGTEVSFPYTPDSDGELFARWEAGICTVTFDPDYENAPAAQTVEVEYNASVAAPAEDPVRAGYVFRYWTLVSGSRTPVVFPFAVTGNVTFYASWRDENVRVFNVTFDYGEYEGAPADSVLAVEEGESVLRSQVTAPVRTGYSLTGWTLGGTAVAFPFTPTGDAVLSAVWTRQEYTLRYMYNYPDCPGGGVYESKPFGAGEELFAPAQDPAREGYTFEGWYTAGKGGTRVEFPTTLARNGTYYAHWRHLPVTTDVFDAEYVPFDPNRPYYGNSGDTSGDGCIIPYNGHGVRVDSYPVNSQLPGGQGFCVSYQYDRGAELVFEITASERITGASLIVNWATERSLTFGPSGENAYAVIVNNNVVNYTPVALQSAVGGDNGDIGDFREITLATNITLNEGVNRIVLVTENDNGAGTTRGAAPITDYIRFRYNDTGKLSWSPVYDNLNGKVL